ncbi:GTPase HflX [Segniliparus rugosus]|uniref:GTPase HflX n=1 Tax=Segniliparus rugosus (strain ATCC BAA-974 / DSM 45345 / CCUG 50838 / CIP 108380 / JCM 13579 / CDC 945) TaxID=679197 RepID=E5XMB9_SEGRC|nr:GTPase HflX [Segniliparus rugosus]EFV14498.1 GTP-binding protein HflX [Segniliparus rugosus ATCC BAA-974]
MSYPESTSGWAAVQEEAEWLWEERDSMRRVPGLSTELADITEVEYRQLRLERVVLVGVWPKRDAAEADASIRELAALARTAGSEVLEGLVQRRDKPDAATYIGSGKVTALKAVVAETGADTVICDGELTPAQLRTLEQQVGVKVIDRTALILDIFAQHATSKEGKAQVTLAQLQYLLPRLRGWGQTLSRQAGGRAGGANGGVGLRGPGETKIETDRRRIRERISRLRGELKEMRKVRGAKRSLRERNEIPSAVIVGYTNAGKSSLLGALTGASVIIRDELFATLDPTTRKSWGEAAGAFTITDTVGFVRHLPTQLVEAFASTLEEATGADVLVHIVDASDPRPTDQVRVVREILGDVFAKAGAPWPPEIVALNKTDLVDEVDLAALRSAFPDALLVSARTGKGIEELKSRIGEALAAKSGERARVEASGVIPDDRPELLAQICAAGQVLESRESEAGTFVRALVPQELADQLAAPPR